MLTNDRLKKIARTRKTRLLSDTNVLFVPPPPPLSLYIYYTRAYVALLCTSPSGNAIEIIMIQDTYRNGGYTWLASSWSDIIVYLLT